MVVVVVMMMMMVITVTEHGSITILWNQGVHTDKVKNKEEIICLLTDVALS
jgi:hypothetical protein